MCWKKHFIQNRVVKEMSLKPTINDWNSLKKWIFLVFFCEIGGAFKYHALVSPRDVSIFLLLLFCLKIEKKYQTSLLECLLECLLSHSRPARQRKHFSRHFCQKPTTKWQKIRKWNSIFLVSLLLMYYLNNIGIYKPKFISNSFLIWFKTETKDWAGGSFAPLTSQLSGSLALWPENPF